MPIYIVAQINIEDRDTYARYEAGFMEIFDRYEGELLAVDEAVTELEGSWEYTRTVIIQFPDEAAARSWYDSDDYQALAQHRFAASAANLAIVQGLG
ncbi:MAG: DUF1330 domain-containing protein [Gammaproteobacteria bacterium]|nr:DUF1330 domain-containing protein [Gammaproteobacteria bacterium]